MILIYQKDNNHLYFILNEYNSKHDYINIIKNLRTWQGMFDNFIFII
jgi:hypothetical protein